MNKGKKINLYEEFGDGAELKKSKIAGTNRKAGRPRKREEDRATQKIIVAFTKREKERIIKAAEKAGVPKSVFIKSILKQNKIF